MMKKLFIPFVLLVVLVSFSNQAEAQVFGTKLKITVIDPLGNRVKDAKVMIFKNESDYRAETNPVQKFKLTDQKGNVTFKKLEAIPYYVIVRKGEFDNSGGGEIISKLEPRKVNKVNIVISDGL